MHQCKMRIDTVGNKRKEYSNQIKNQT